MTELGYTLSSEEFGPNDLIEYAQQAEQRGFDFASISDHYHPWTSEQGNSPFVWSTLGGIAQATDDLPIGVGVTCPTVRIHPAIIAQAAATAATMLPERFFFGVGSGENLNEHVVGERWPELDVRLDMLEEAVGIIRDLWEGETYSHHGEHFTVENARIYTLPEEPPPIHVSAFGGKSARSAANIGEGLWCVGPQEGVLDTFRDAGGEGPAYTQVDVCYAEDEDEAVETAYNEWPNGFISGEMSQLLPMPAHFEQAASMIDHEDVVESSVPMGPDPDEHIETIQECYDAGFDHVYVHQIGPDQEDFFEFYEDEVMPAFE